jgi:hypothetical protein
MRTLRDARRAEVERLRWCERPVLLRVLVHAFDQVEQTHHGPQPLEQLARAHRIREWLERVSARV